MRYSVLLLVTLTAVSTEAQGQPLVRRPSERMLFGSLLADRSLQDELKLTQAQIKRMQEIYIQSQPPANVIFSPWGIKELGISEGQLKRLREMERDHLKEMLRIRKEAAESLGGNDFRLQLQKRQQMQAAFEQERLKVLTQSQWKRFEELRGKLYKPFGKLPGRPKPKADI